MVQRSANESTIELMMEDVFDEAQVGVLTRLEERKRKWES